MKFIYDSKTSKIFDENHFYESIQFLKELGERSNIEIIDDSNFYEAFNFFILSIVYDCDETNVLFSICENLKVDIIFCNILNKLFKNKNSIDFDYSIEPFNQTFISNPAKRYGRLFIFCIHSINVILVRLPNFCRNIEILKSQLNFIKDEDFLLKHLDSEFKDFGFRASVLDSLVLNINSMSKNCEDIIDKWNELNVANTLLNLGTRKDSAKFNSYLCLINLFDDKNIESIPEIQYVLDKLIDMIMKTAQDFENNNITRIERQIIETNRTRLAEIYSQSFYSVINISLFGIINPLYRLSVNNTMKKKIYFQYNTKGFLRSILEKSNNDETEIILSLIAQLSFDEEIANDLKLDEWFMKKFQSYSSNQFGDGVQQLSEKILWNLKDLAKYRSASFQVLNGSIQKDSQNNLNKHIMISYNSGSRDFCLKVKENLEKYGHKVWINVDENHGSNLEGMPKAVEESTCVIICVTEKYRHNLNCQAEAKYAFNIKKAILILISQNGFQDTTGWIGIIIGDKIYINFTDNDLGECIKRLKNEIFEILESKNEKEIFNPIEAPEEKIIEKWNEAQVEEWFNKNSIDNKMKNKILPCPDVILKQLYDIKKSYPKLDNQSRESQVTLKSMITFTHYFVEQFKKDK